MESKLNDTWGLDPLECRRRYRGLIGVQSKIPIKDRAILSLVYTPGVAEACLEIASDPTASFDLSCRGNTVAVVTDGSVVQGLGNVGPEAVLPVMEARCILLKTFAGVDAFPICLATQSASEIVQVLTLLAPTFGAFCLEDICSPKGFTVAEQLERATDISVFHAHQHATAIVVLAGLLNSLKLVGKKLSEVSIVISGAGNAGIGVARGLLHAGARNIVLCDRAGALYEYRSERMNWAKWEIARRTNPEGKRGPLSQALRGADVFIGVSGANLVTAEMVKSMAPGSIVFALAVPEPEIMPAEAKRGGAKIVATGRADFPNQVNIALAFPGALRGLLDTRTRDFTEDMIIPVAEALANLVPEQELYPDHIMPKVFDFRVAPAVAAAIAKAAIENGMALVKVDPQEIARRTLQFVYEGQMPPLPMAAGRAQKMRHHEALELRRRYQGVLEVKSKIPIKDDYILSLFYLPPRAAEPVRKILEDVNRVYDYTAKGNLVAIVTDGSAVLGLGNIGPRAALPVMEGKAVLFQTFAGVEAFPICLATQDASEIVTIVKAIAPVFGGINLEDIAAPRCFAVEEQLKRELAIPIFHDDQHGTAVVVLAGLINALKLVGKSFDQIKVTMSGAGAAGIATGKLLLKAGVKNLVLCDSVGAIYQGRSQGMNWAKEEIAAVTNPDRLKGSLAEVIQGSDVFIGVSAEGVLSAAMVSSMAKDPIVFALANPNPEIWPKEAKAAGAKIVATGRSDFPNQVNNCLAFPGIFRGALDARLKQIDDDMKIAAAQAIAGLVAEDALDCNRIIPEAMDFRVAPAVAAAVARVAMATGQARIEVEPEKIAEDTRRAIYEGELGRLSRSGL